LSYPPFVPIPIQRILNQGIQMKHSVKLIQAENSVQQDSFIYIKDSSRRNIDTRNRQRNALDTNKVTIFKQCSSIF
jgi:hypothetical protein